MPPHNESKDVGHADEYTTKARIDERGRRLRDGCRVSPAEACDQGNVKYEDIYLKSASLLRKLLFRRGLIRLGPLSQVALA